MADRATIGDSDVADADVVDVLGIGFGPANIALAIALLEDHPSITSLFVEAELDPLWQSGMLLKGADIQHVPDRDLVSLRNPRSRYSFRNYLFEAGRLVDHLNLPMEFPLRREYAEYIAWARRQLPVPVRYGSRVVDIEVDSRHGTDLYRVTDSAGRRFRARSLVVGPGRTPNIPDSFRHVSGDRAVHLNHYLPRVTAWAAAEPRCVVVVGGSQSAVEIALDLVARFPACTVQILARSWSLRAKDHSPFSEEIYFPSFTKYYHAATAAQRRHLDAYTRPTNYSAADKDVLDRLYVEIYEQRLMGEQRVFTQGDTVITSVAESDSGIEIHAEQVVSGERSRFVADLVVLATGFRDMGKGENQEPHHPLLDGVADLFRWTPEGYLDVAEDYSLLPTSAQTPALFLNGLCESTHGIGDAGSFSLLSVRAATIGAAVERSVRRSRDLESRARLAPLTISGGIAC